MIIDVHTHIGVDPAYEEDMTAKELVTEMKKSGIDKCVVFPFTTNPDIKEQNAIVKAALDKYPDKLIGFFTMNPKLPEMTDLMFSYKNQGFKGVVTDPRFGVGYEAKRFHELVECAIEIDMPIWLHTDNKDSMRVYIYSLQELLEKYSSVKFILSSMFYGSVQGPIKLVARYKNLYMDTATAMSGSMTATAIQPVGTHRILLGSNSPYGLLRREKEKITILEELTAFQKSLILGRNAARLLKL